MKQEALEKIRATADKRFHQRVLSTMGPRGWGYFDDEGELLYETSITAPDKSEAFEEKVYRIPFGFYTIEKIEELVSKLAAP